MARHWSVLIGSWRVTVLFCASQSWSGTSPWSSGKCGRFGAGRSGVRLSAGSYQDLVNWYCSLLIRRTVWGRATGNTKTNWVKWKPGKCTNSVVALQDLCSYKAPTTNHHIKPKIVKWRSTVKWSFDFYLFVVIYRFFSSFVQVCWSSTL